MLDNYGYRHTLGIRNTFCFSTTSILSRKRLKVTLLTMRVLLCCGFVLQHCLIHSTANCCHVFFTSQFITMTWFHLTWKRVVKPRIFISRLVYIAVICHTLLHSVVLVITTPRRLSDTYLCSGREHRRPIFRVEISWVRKVVDYIKMG
jgi:ABC-type iron transport system FetAB permease component